MSGAISIRDRIGQALGRWLERDRAQFEPRAALDPDMLIRTLRRGDVLLVEGRAKDFDRDQVSDAKHMVPCRALCGRHAAGAGGRIC